jgi:hypothetical protein
MTKENIQSSSYPDKILTYNKWCKKYKVGSRVQKFNTVRFYTQGEYDQTKLIKIIENYGTEQKQQSSIWSERLKRLRSILA